MKNTVTLDELAQAYQARQKLRDRLTEQESYISDLVRRGRAQGLTWTDMAAAGGVTDVAVINASRRHKAA